MAQQRRNPRQDPGAPPGGRFVRAGAGRWLVVAVLALGVQVLSLFAFVAPARATEFGGGERVRIELVRTDQVIQRAVDNLRQCASDRSKVLLRQSRDLQAQAWRLYNPIDPTLPVVEILLYTRKARDLAADAIEACQVETQAHESLRTMLDSTSDLLRDADLAVGSSRNPEARLLLEAGTTQLDRAREAYRAGEYRRAIMLGGAARALVQRAVQRANSGERASEAARVEAALDRAEVILADVRLTPGTDSDARVRSLLERAQKDLDRGRELLGKGRLGVAWRSAASAREAALDALWLLQRVPETSTVQAGYDLVTRLLGDVEPEIRASGSDESVRFLTEAQAQLETARGALASGDPARAAESVRTADTLIRRAAEKAGR